MAKLSVAAVACGAAALSTSSAQTTVQPNPKQTWGTWKGWGTSIAWYGNALGGRSDVAGLIFGQNYTTYNSVTGSQTVPSLAMNIARYNVGGTRNDTVNGTRVQLSPNYPSWKQIEGYWIDGASVDPTSNSWDWNADFNQRSAVGAAYALGASVFEFFSNSPMWWMLYNHNPSGSNDGTSDNLNSSYWRAHAQYMAIVATQTYNNWDVQFPVNPEFRQAIDSGARSINGNPIVHLPAAANPSSSSSVKAPPPANIAITVEAFNEPIADWWKSSGTQEGCHFDASTQGAILPMLRQELDARGVTRQQIAIASSDESQTDMAYSTWMALNSTARAPIDTVNVHGYQGTSGNRSGLYEETVVIGGKALRMSEHGDGDATGQTLAQNMLLDFNELHMTSWVYWQTYDISSGWALIQAPSIDTNPNGLLGSPDPKFYVLAQYSRHVTPSSTILDAGDATGSTVVSWNAITSTLTIVTTNMGNKPAQFSYDLSLFATASGPITRWVTTMDTNGPKYQPFHDVTIYQKAFTSTVPANSVVTFEVSDVEP